RGLLKTLGGTVTIYLLWPLGLMELLERLWNLDKPNSPMEALSYLLLAAMTSPFVLFFVGLCELATGKRFRVLESAWRGLNEWLQGLFSFLLICLAIAVLLLLVHLITGHALF